MKTGSQDFLEKQRGDNYQNINFSKDNFNLTKFNKIYSENRVADAYDEGYGDWSKQNKFDSEVWGPQLKILKRGQDSELRDAIDFDQRRKGFGLFMLSKLGMCRVLLVA